MLIDVLGCMSGAKSCLGTKPSGGSASLLWVSTSAGPLAVVCQRLADSHWRLKISCAWEICSDGQVARV